LRLLDSVTDNSSLMQPLIALKSIPSLERLSTLKRYALLFDSFYVTQHFGVTNIPGMRNYASLEAQATFDFLCETQILQMPPTGFSVTDLPLMPEVRPIMNPYAERLLAHFESPNKMTEKAVWDVLTRLRTFELEKNTGMRAVPILEQAPPPALTSLSPALSDVLSIGVDYLPVPSANCSWQDILDTRTELRDKLWAFRRFLRGLAATTKTEPEIRDEIEWSLNEYQNAMKLHRLKTARSALELFVIPPLEFAENLVKLNWSKIAKGALSIRKRKIELMEAEMNAPGREVGYVFETQQRFQKKQHRLPAI
jgi:hypothetical protein